MVNADFQIVHASRGCIRWCAFCGTYEIEPEFSPKKTIAGEIVKNHIVFYDNNLLANPHIEDILDEVSGIRINNRVVKCESQSGIDGRLLMQKPSLASSLKKARLQNPRIAWDGRFSQRKSIRRQVDVLLDAGFAARDVQVFMLYNHKLPPDEVALKVAECFSWGVQVSDCRYRPLDLFSDGYAPNKKSQADTDYYVHDGWTDARVRGLRKTVRANNICIRYRIPRERYVQQYERFPASERRAICRELGITDVKLSGEQLDLVNATWRARKTKEATPAS